MASIFEMIIAGEIPAEFIHRDKEVVAFRDINPVAPVHVLVVPTKPIPTIDDVTDADIPVVGRMYAVARDIARSEGVAEQGYRLVMNCRDHGGQEVPHLHLHLIGGRQLGPMVGSCVDPD